MFHDPSLPLVVDLGCGMGVSLHGLATLRDEAKHSNQTGQTIHLHWSKCNYIGVDLSRLAIGYANAIASRSGVSARLQYVVDSAETFLQTIAAYPGNVHLLLIQFPTPYRLNHQSELPTSMPESKGNRQLPKHPYAGFMVTANLFKLARDALLPGSGKLLLQSNCEDVAVYMRKLATEHGAFDAVPIPNPLNSFQQSNTRTPQRTLDYIKMGGQRALGMGWAAGPLLPRRGSTETELACFLETTPIHRCLLVPSKQKSLD